MGKLPKMKDRTTSAKSRAGRRANSASPGAEATPKIAESEWQDVSQPDLSILSARSGSGVTKKSTKGQKRVSRAQRMRKEKAMDMADAIEEKLRNKVTISKKKAKVIKDRASTWEDLNSGKKTSKKDVRLAQLKQDMASRSKNGETMDTDAMEVEKTSAPSNVNAQPNTTAIDMIT